MYVRNPGTALWLWASEWLTRLVNPEPAATVGEYDAPVDLPQS